MFFFLGEQCERLTQQFQFGDLNLFLDEGWNKAEFDNKTVFFKGYCLDYNLSTDIQAVVQNEDFMDGVFCVIVFDHSANRVTFRHSHARSFPCNYTAEFVTNLPIYPSIWLHSGKTIIIQDGVITETEPKPYIPYQFDTKGKDYITVDEAAAAISEIIIDNIRRYVKNNPEPLHLFYSGGIDTLTSWTLLDHLGVNFTTNADIITEDYREVRYKTPLMEHIIQTPSYSGYDQIEYSATPKRHVTGFWGDENFLRIPMYTNFHANLKGTTAEQVAIDHPEYYASSYMLRPSHIPIVSKMESWTEEAVKDRIRDVALHNYVIWHIDHNIYFTPMNDMRIMEIMMGLSVDDLLDNGFNATVQRKIVAMFDPDRLSWLDEIKNNKSYKYKNFIKNYQK